MALSRVHTLKTPLALLEVAEDKVPVLGVRLFVLRIAPTVAESEGGGQDQSLRVDVVAEGACTVRVRQGQRRSRVALHTVHACQGTEHAVCHHLVSTLRVGCRGMPCDH